jgi:hypothetical protein
MGGKSRWDYLKAIYSRYKKVSKPLRARILDAFCQVCGYNRKYAIRLLNGPAPQKPEVTTAKGRRATYWAKVISLTTIWRPRSIHAQRGSKLSYRCGSPGRSSAWRLRAQVQNQLLSISPATIDRRFKAKKRQLKKRLYGRTKPGTLLKHHIPIKTDSWDVKTPALPKPIWSLTPATPRRASSSTRSTSPTFTPPGWKLVPLWAKAKQECLTR